ncbi:hypothetical protein [Micromonospora sp. CPCC 206061]|uniref:hypothetical protein n=1 Tax=Micromonospora sp. CPCC 206061 TaxID=3122410 RepID=UPI002FF341D0
MLTARKRRIGHREAEQMLSTPGSDPTHPELSYLLAAAAAPPRSDELVGLAAAVAAYERAGFATGETAVPAPRRSWLTRSVAVKAAAGTAVLLMGGTALAAETGNLPNGAQQQAHDLFSGLGVPPPGARASATPTPGGTPSARPTPAPSPSNHGRTISPSSPAALGLCRAWEAGEKKPTGKKMAAEAFQDLLRAAGGEANIAKFCAPLLDAGPAENGQGPPSAKPSRPNEGKGRGRPTTTPHQKG